MRVVFFMLVSLFFLNAADIHQGKIAYRICIPCHGVMGELDSSGDSMKISSWNKTMFIDSLMGYKNDTYGRSKKEVMKLFVDKLSKEQIENIAAYIVEINSDLKTDDDK